jgi:hypothetical protein
MAKEIKLPDLEANWQWCCRLSPHISEIGQQCLDWVAKFKVFNSEQAQKAFDKCNFSEFGAEIPNITDGFWC